MFIWILLKLKREDFMWGIFLKLVAFWLWFIPLLLSLEATLGKWKACGGHMLFHPESLEHTGHGRKVKLNNLTDMKSIPFSILLFFLFFHSLNWDALTWHVHGQQILNSWNIQFDYALLQKLDENTRAEC